MPKVVDRKKKTTFKTVVTKDPCAICREPLKRRTVATIDCVHRYCYDCIKEWSTRENTCPLCKKEFEQITRVSTNAKESVSKTSQVADRNLDDRYGHYTFILDSFLNSRLFRSRIELGLLNGQRAPIVIFLILQDIIDQLREHDIMPPVASLENYDLAFDWLDRMDTIVAGLRLHTIQFIR